MTVARWTAEDERHTARAIQEATRQTRELLARAQAAARAAGEEDARPCARTLLVDLLPEAVRAMVAQAETPALRALAGEAAQTLASAESLGWMLAMSARRIAHGEARKLVNPLLEEEDLVQEGYLGLIRAARRFDPERGIRFVTYARWWVRAHMTRAVECTGRLVRLPGGVVEQLRNLRQATALLDRAGGAPDLATLAQRVGVVPQRLELLLSVGSLVFLEQPDDNGLCLLDRLAVDERQWPEARASVAQALQCVEASFERVLAPRERFVLIRHFGLDGEEPQSMAELGLVLGLSRQRTRQVENEALRRLRELIAEPSAAPDPRDAGRGRR